VTFVFHIIEFLHIAVRTVSFSLQYYIVFKIALRNETCRLKNKKRLYITNSSVDRRHKIIIYYNNDCIYYNMVFEPPYWNLEAETYIVISAFIYVWINGGVLCVGDEVARRVYVIHMVRNTMCVGRTHICGYHNPLGRRRYIIIIIILLRPPQVYRYRYREIEVTSMV